MLSHKISELQSLFAGMDSSQLQSTDKDVAEKTLSSLLEALNQGIPREDDSALCQGLMVALDNHSEQLAAMIAEVFAALAKEESFRDVAVSQSVVPRLTPLLAATPTATPTTTHLQTLRAIGNLCFDHDANRSQVLSSGGCPLLVGLLTSCCSLPADGQHERLKCVTCGCILNVTNQNEELTGEFLGLDVVRHLTTLLTRDGEREAVLQMGLQALINLLGSAGPSLPPPLSSSPLASMLSHLLQRCNEEQLELCEGVLEVMQILVESDQWKIALVKSGCGHHLVGVVDPELQQKAIDIIILLLAEDSCLQRLFEQGSVLLRALEWLGAASGPLERRASAALLVANIARNDTTCAALVERGVVPLLVELAKMEEPEQLSGKVHFAAFSALRNLSLPAAHKQLFLREGVVDAALHALRHSSMAHIWFKALATLRLLTDKQVDVCSHIVSEEGSVSRVCEICETCASVGPIHLQIEGGRLLAAIVKHCSNAAVMQRVAAEGGVKWVLFLLELEFSLLRNEGLVALNLLAALQEAMEKKNWERGYSFHMFELLAPVFSSLEEAGTVPRIAKLLAAMGGGGGGGEGGGDSPPEILSNTLTLVDALNSDQPGALRGKMQSSAELKSALEALHAHGDNAVRTKAKGLSEQLFSSL